ncbi:hypothetical protein GGR56DRAFT_641835 [Xylariaceae sp. FL0804]|nr:hypothetical protein GGR56DRAFT_641835 [Xylariaceae sp. FL0804]
MSREGRYTANTYPNPYHAFEPPVESPPPDASQVTVIHDPIPLPRPGHEPQFPTPSSQQTVIHYAPSPPQGCSPPPGPSGPGFLRLDRSSDRPLRPRHDARRPLNQAPAPSAHFDHTPLLMGAQRDPLAHRDFKDDLARSAGMVTPGIDDTPYIRYALDALTRPSDDGHSVSEITSLGGEQVHTSHHPFMPQPGLDVSQPAPAHQPPQSARDMGAVPSDTNVSPRTPTGSEIFRDARRRRAELRAKFPEDAFIQRHSLDFSVDDLPPLEEYWTPAPQAESSAPRTLDVWQAQPDQCRGHDLEKAQHFAPPLTYKPWILRPQSLLLLTTLCLLIIAALIFSAVFSVGRDALTTFDGSIYGGQYFLFRMLPQLIGVVILVYAQCVISAAFRILAFSKMAAEDRRERRNAVFLPMYVKSFLWPQLIGPWNIWVPTLVVWLMNITIPLFSALFTVVLVDDVWMWSTVQGVAWTLVALYLALLLSVLVTFAYWRQRRTGMMAGWDIRTIADIIFLVSQSNSLSQYRGLESAVSRKQMRQVLDGTAERLGYWFTPEAPNNYTFYSIGTPTTENDLAVERLDHQNWAQKRREGHFAISSDSEEVGDKARSRVRYLPWCFRDSQIAFAIVAGAILLVALLVVSFMHSTALRDGFLPLLPAGPVGGAFSAADFLYSFLPSLLGLVLFLLFQSFDQTLRILAPWGELERPEGSRATTSLLLDYAACMPWQSTYTAVKLKHWRVAFVTALSPLFALLPVLGGGLFMALTPPSGVVRVFPNMPAFAIILTLLFLYLLALVSLVPGRRRFRLPHAATCLAEVISFCCNEQLRTDLAFDFDKVGGHRDLRGQLDAGVDWHRQGRWDFSSGRHGDERMGIKRSSRYTVNSRKLKQFDRRARGQRVSRPLPKGSGSLFGRRVV